MITRTGTTWGLLALVVTLASATAPGAQQKKVVHEDDGSALRKAIAGTKEQSQAAGQGNVAITLLAKKKNALVIHVWTMDLPTSRERFMKAAKRSQVHLLDGTDTLAVSIDPASKRGDVTQFVEKQGPRFPVTVRKENVKLDEFLKPLVEANGGKPVTSVSYLVMDGKVKYHYDHQYDIHKLETAIAVAMRHEQGEGGTANRP